MNIPHLKSPGNSSVRPLEDRRLFGISLMLAALLLLSCLDAAAKWLIVSGMPPMQVSFTRFAINFLLVLAIFAPRTSTGLFKTNNIKLEFLRGFAVIGATICNFLAIQYLPLPVTGSIMFSIPLIICGLSVPLLGENVGWRRWIAIGVGFLGVLVIVRPGGTDFHWAMGLSLASATCAAFYSIFTRKLAGRDSTATQQIYTTGLATLCLLPALFAGDWQWPQNPSGWLAFGALGILAGFGHLMATAAYRFAPASVLAPFIYSQIIYLTGLSWILFQEPPSTTIFFGAPIVMASGLYIWLRERRLYKSKLSLGPIGSDAPLERIIN